MATRIFTRRQQPVQAWCYDGESALPWWVARDTVHRDGEMLLIRQSGRVVVNAGEWLVRNLDGGIVLYSPEEFSVLFTEMDPKR